MIHLPSRRLVSHSKSKQTFDTKGLGVAKGLILKVWEAINTRGYIVNTHANHPYTMADLQPRRIEGSVTKAKNKPLLLIVGVTNRRDASVKDYAEGSR